MLASPSLLGIETEILNEVIDEAITSHGFVRRYYDPARRILSADPIDGLRHANVLFVRDETEITKRIKTAPARRVHGHGLT